MHIVIVSHKPPFPEIDGGCIATANMIQNLQEMGHKVNLFCFATTKHPFPAKEIFPEWFKKCDPEYDFINTESTFFGALMSLFNASSYFISRFKSKKLKQKITSYTNDNQIDILQIESLYSFNPVDFDKIKIPIVYRSHNVEHKIWEGRIAEETNGLKRFFLKKSNKKLMRFEKQAAQKVNGIMTLTSAEKIFFQSFNLKIPISIIQPGFEIFETSNVNTKDLFYIGAFDWQPNVKGIEWFLEKVFPIIQQKQPEIQFHIAGKGLNKKKYNGIKGLVNHGEVADKTAFFNNYRIMILPLFSGSGLRIKLIEALLFGKAVVSTQKGAEGIDFENNKTCFITDKPEEFAQFVLDLYSNKNLLLNTEQKAKVFATSHFSKEKLKENLADFYAKL